MKNFSNLLLVTFFLLKGNSSFAQTQDDTIKYSGWRKELSISILGKTEGNLKVYELTKGKEIKLIGKDSNKYIIESFVIVLSCGHMDPKFWRCQGNQLCQDLSSWRAGCALIFSDIVVIDSKKQHWLVDGASYKLAD